MTKIYRTNTLFSLPVIINGKTEYVHFSEEHYGAAVMDEKVQKAVEKSSYFKSGEIKLFKTTGGDVKEVKNKSRKTPEVTKREYPEVKTVQEAVFVLEEEPYMVNRELLSSPESVKIQAEAAGVKFPGLIL